MKCWSFGETSETTSGIYCLVLPTMVSANARWTRLQWMQVISPLSAIPIGCYFIYNAILSYNRSPPPLSSNNIKNRKLYTEPVFQAISFAPSTFAANARSRDARTR